MLKEYEEKIQSTILFALGKEFGKPKSWTYIYEFVRKAIVKKGFSKHTLAKYLRKLENEKLIKRVKIGKKREHYELVNKDQLVEFGQQMAKVLDEWETKTLSNIQKLCGNIEKHVLTEEQMIAFILGIIADFELHFIKGLQLILGFKRAWHQFEPYLADLFLIKPYNFRIRLFDTCYKSYPEATKKAFDEIEKRKREIILETPQYNTVFEKLMR